MRLKTLIQILRHSTPGEATIDPCAPIAGRNHVVVGIIGSKKCIAICGETGGPDEVESIANATLIAYLWNEYQNIQMPSGMRNE